MPVGCHHLFSIYTLQTIVKWAPYILRRPRIIYHASVHIYQNAKRHKSISTQFKLSLIHRTRPPSTPSSALPRGVKHRVQENNSILEPKHNTTSSQTSFHQVVHACFTFVLPHRIGGVLGYITNETRSPT